MSPAQFMALTLRHEAQMTYSDWNFGMIVSTIANLFVKEKKHLVSALEVMGYEPDEAPDARPQREQSALETALKFRLLRAAQKHATMKGVGPK